MGLFDDDGLDFLEDPCFPILPLRRQLDYNNSTTLTVNTDKTVTAYYYSYYYGSKI
ncbi:MAG: hypothetical protein QXM52_00485 [Candidatus Bathyarchaeia archaeon]